MLLHHQKLFMHPLQKSRMLNKKPQNGVDPLRNAQVTKQAMLSAANKALVHKSRNPTLSDNDVLTHIMSNLDRILQEVKEEN